MVMRQKLSTTQKALNLWAVILIAWSIYRVLFKLPEWFDEFIAKPLVFVLPVYFFVKRVDRKEFFGEIGLRPKKVRADLFLALGAGLLFIVTALFSNYIRSGKLALLKESINSSAMIFPALIIMATAVSEEILSRGFILKKLYDESGNIFTASFFGSVLFFFLHIPILFTSKITGTLLLLYIITDLIISLINSFIFLERKSLILPILIHAFYNLSLVFFI